jgi:hypothetical protein
MEADTNGRGGLEYREPSGAKDIIEIASQVQVVEKQYEYLLMGRHLIEAGLKPSAEFGIILGKANEAQENGEFDNVDSAKIWLNDYLEKSKDKFMIDNGLGDADMKNDITLPRT